MRQLLIAVAIALTVSILLTPVLIKLFTRQGFGHEIREDGPPSHRNKRGTPSMGGVAIVAGIWASYFGTHLVGVLMDGKGPSASGLLVLGLATALGGVGAGARGGGHAPGALARQGPVPRVAHPPRQAEGRAPALGNARVAHSRDAPGAGEGAGHPAPG